MMKKRFLTPLHEICSKEKINGPFHYIYFRDGFMYATNGRVAVKQRAELHKVFTPDQVTLENMCIHKDVFKLLKGKEIEFDFITNIKHSNIIDGIVARIKMGGKNVEFDLPHIEEVTGKGKIIDQINKSFSNFDMEKAEEVALDPDTITLIKKVFVTKSSGFTFRFNNGKGVLVTPNQDNIKEHAMIVPLLITGKLCR